MARKRKPRALRLAGATKPDQSTQDAIFELLLGRILSGALQAGSMLPSERELSSSCKASRNTVREAIRRLEQLRLVSTRHGQGASVQDFRRTGTVELLGAYLQYGQDPREQATVVLDLLGPRLQMAEQLITLAIERATPADLEVLDWVAVSGRDAELAKDVVGVAAAQDRWLDALVNAAHSIPLRWTANPLLAALNDLLRRQPLLMPLEPSFTSYATAVVEAFRRRDLARALAACREFHEGADQALRYTLNAMLAEERTPT